MLIKILLGTGTQKAAEPVHYAVVGGDRIVVTDSASGRSPHKISTKIINKDLHIFAEGSEEPSAILHDYETFEHSVQISGIGEGGGYVDYAPAEAGTMELGGAAPVAASDEPYLSMNALLGIGALAVAGGIAAAAGGGSDDSPAENGGSDPEATTPTATITLSDTALMRDETSTVTVVFSEAVAGFSNEDIDLSNAQGTLSPFTTLDNITWTATFTPSAETNDSTNIIALSAGSYTNAEGTVPGAGAVSANFAIDTATIPTPLTLSITDDEGGATANIAGGSILYTFTFGEAVNGFTADDVNVENGTKGVFTQLSGSVYTLVVTPATGFEGNVTVSVASGAATNSAGTASDSATSHQAVDMLAPVVTSVTLADTDLTEGETTSLTITFSEAVKNFSNATLDLGGAKGTLSTLSSSDNTTWVALFTPTADTVDPTNVIRVLNTYTDMAGNAGSLGESGNFAVDTTMSVSDALKPVLTMTDDEPMITANMDGSNSDGSVDANGADILYTFTFSEAVRDFTIDDIVVTMERTDGTVDSTYTAATDPGGAVLRTFTKVADNVYTLGVRPEAGYEGVMRVGVSADAATDMAGNTIDDSNPSTLSSLQAVDMRAPFPFPLEHGSLSVSAYDVEHQRLVLTFDENLEQVNQASPGNFGVMINYDEVEVRAIGVSDNSAGMADNQVFLYLEPVTNARGESFDWGNAGITVAYTDAGADLTPVIHDLAGNDATSFNDYIADTLSPDVKITMSDTVLSSGDTPTITFAFSEQVSLNLSDLDLSQANGTMDTLSSADGGKTWTGTFIPDIGIQDTTNIITLEGTYTDQAGNFGVASATGNYLIDTKAPTLLSVTGNGANDTFSLLFDEPLDAVNFASSDMFYVTDGTLTPAVDDGNALARFEITAVSVLGSHVTLSVDPSIESTAGTVWTLTYVDQPGNDTLALQDIYGSDVSSFTQTAVI